MASRLYKQGDILHFSDDEVYDIEWENYGGPLTQEEHALLVAEDPAITEFHFQHVRDTLWKAFKAIAPNGYADFIGRWGLEYVKDLDTLWRLLGIEGFTQFDVRSMEPNELGLEEIEVEWYDWNTASHNTVIIRGRPDAECPICETEYAHDSDAGEKERAFIRKWGRCPDCVEEAIVCFCQGDRTDDTSFLYQPGDYLMWWRLDLIRSSFAELGSELSEEAEDALWHVQRYSAPGYVMYGR